MKVTEYVLTGKMALVCTHGGSGYAAGSYWDGDDIICGACGDRIKNPRPTGSRTVWVWDDGILGKLHLKGHKVEIMRYGPAGEKPVRHTP